MSMQEMQNESDTFVHETNPPSRDDIVLSSTLALMHAASGALCASSTFIQCLPAYIIRVKETCTAKHRI